MGPVPVVIDPSFFDDPFRPGQAHEPVHVQAFFVEPTVETFNIGVLCWLAGVDEIEIYAMIIGPAIKDFSASGDIRDRS